MKIAVLTDIHANFRALETVYDDIDRWGPDQVFVAGDIVNRGPRSLECLKFIQAHQREQGWQVIRGNHEDYIINQSQPDIPKSGPTYELLRPIHWTVDQLSGHIQDLEALPEQISQHNPFSGELRMVHASMHGNRIGIYPETQDAELARLIAPAPALLLVGHTHRPLVRSIGKSLVVNAGSVGLPFDGDARASYARVYHQQDCWQAEIIRLPYDIDAASRDFSTVGFDQGGGPLVQLILLEMQTGLSQLYQWVMRYSQPVQNGEISVEQAVFDFLQDPITTPYW